MNTQKKIVIIIGSGSIANKHIQILSKMKFNIYVLIQNNFEKKRYDKNNLTFIKFIKSLKGIDKKDILFAIVASSTYKHIRDINFFIKYKINIFCEKPISHNIISLNSLKKKIVKNKIFFYVNYQLRQHDFLKKIKKIIQSEKVYHIESRVGDDLRNWRKNKIRKNSYFISNEKGGGVIFELIHEINLLNHLFGNIKKIKTIKKNYNIKNAEDIALSAFMTNKGNIGTLIQDMIAKKRERYLKISTSKNLYKFNFIKNTINFYKNNKILTIKNKNKINQISLIKKNIIYYIKWINSKKFSTNYFDEAKKDIQTCLKMHEKI